MELNSWPGLIAVILSIISFYGTTYLVIALNVGWRFGYWLSSACFGALMVLLSIFWTVNVQPDQALGPQGAVPKWIPIAAGPEIQQASFRGVTISSPANYPTAWEQPEEGDPQIEAFTSAIAGCLTGDTEEIVEPDEKSACEAAQELMPDDRDIPVIDGTAVAVQPEVTEVRFTDDNGRLAEAVVTPLTKDPRVSDNPGGEALADPFRLVAILDKGSVGLPSYMSLVIFSIYFLFHLWGLNRAEKKKLQPAVI